MHLLHVAVRIPLPQSCSDSISNNVLLGYWLMNRLANFSSSSSSSFLFIFFMRYTSAIRCDVTLPQKSTPDCKIARKAALAENKKTWTLKHDPDVYGFARLNMTPTQLAAIVFKDPFTRYYTTAYTQTLKTNEKVLTQYINQTLGQPINDFSEYLAMSEFFQTVLEPLVGVITVLLFSSTLRCKIHCVLPVGGGGLLSQYLGRGRQLRI